MRLVLTRSLIALAITCGFVALGLHLSATALAAPDRPARVVAAMLATPEGRQQVASALTGLISAQAPGANPAQVSAGVHQLLDDPGTAAALGRYAEANTDDGRTQALDAALAPLTVTDPALARAISAQVKTAQGALPGQDPLGVLVPAEVRAGISGYRDLLGRCAAGAALISGALALAALVLGPRRAWLLRRLGRATLLASGLQLLVLWAVPTYLLPAWHSPWAPVFTAGLHAAGLGLLALFFALAVGGLLLVGLGALAGLAGPVGSARDLPAPIRGLSARRAKAGASARRANRR